jgi:anti-sigma regulatory factor (Ser/Thr protein kinase)
MATNGDQPLADELTVRLPANSGSARVARQLVSDLLDRAGWGRGPVQDAELVTHELVMNGVVHGRADPAGAIGVCCSLSADQVRICVHDSGAAGAVEVQPPSTHKTSGRGLALVDALCSSWAVDRSDGTRVSAWLTG